MTSEAFCDKFRPILLGLMAEAYCFRKLPPSEFGMLMDAQHHRLGLVLRQMFNTMQAETLKPPDTVAPPKAGPQPSAQRLMNGHKSTASVA